MSDLQAVIPTSEVYLTLEELADPDNEIIFVQHPEEIDQKDIEEALKLSLSRKHSKGVKLTAMDENPCYPLGFGDNQMHIIRKFDRYFVALPKEEDE